MYGRFGYRFTKHDAKIGGWFAGGCVALVCLAVGFAMWLQP